MTYGPPNSGGYNPAPGASGGQPYPQGAPGYGAPQRPQSPLVANLKAPSAAAGDKLFIVGIVVAVLGLIVVVFSCLSWLSVDDDDSPVGISVSGLGGVSLDFDSSKVPSEYRDGAQESFDDGKAETEERLEEDTEAGGGWTLAFGILAILSAVPLIIRKFQSFGAIAVTAFGLAATICAIVFVASDGRGVVDKAELSDDDIEAISTGYGLWIVLVGSILLLLAGVFALALALLPEKFGATPAPAYGAGYGAPQTGYGQPQGTGYGQPQNYGYGDPQQPGYGTGGQLGGQPGYPQPGQPNQYGQTQYNQYPGQGGTPQ